MVAVHGFVAWYAPTVGSVVVFSALWDDDNSEGHCLLVDVDGNVDDVQGIGNVFRYMHIAGVTIATNWLKPSNLCTDVLGLHAI